MEFLKEVIFAIAGGSGFAALDWKTVVMLVIACVLLYMGIGKGFEAGFADNFMGATQKAKFIGHGIGLEINEMPVLAPRMKQELEPVSYTHLRALADACK